MLCILSPHVSKKPMIFNPRVLGRRVKGFRAKG